MATRAIIKTVVESLVSIVAGAAGFALGDQSHADRRGASFHFKQAVMAGIATVAYAMQPMGEKCGWKRTCRAFITFTLKLQITWRPGPHGRCSDGQQQAAEKQRYPLRLCFNWYQHFG